MRPTQPDAPVDVLYIGGYGRSGSTLVSLLLDTMPDVYSLGEIRHLWKTGVRSNELCSCGERFHDCPFWARVGDEAFGGWDGIDAARIIAFEEEFVRIRFLPLLMAPGIWPGFQARFNEYRDVLARLYGALHRVSESRFVIDASKDPSYALALQGVPGVRLHVAQLVRDSRGVAYSWMKQVVKPEVVDTQSYMDRFGPATSSLRWLSRNGCFPLLRLFGVPRRVIRYEKLVSSPGEELRRILDLLSATDQDLAFLEESEITPGGRHMIGGNPVRFNRQVTRLRVDDEWRTRMRPKDRTLVTLLTWPLLLRYGYLLPTNGAGGRSR
jgi:hypothetical protein